MSIINNPKELIKGRWFSCDGAKFEALPDRQAWIINIDPAARDALPQGVIAGNEEVYNTYIALMEPVEPLEPYRFMLIDVSADRRLFASRRFALGDLNKHTDIHDALDAFDRYLGQLVDLNKIETEYVYDDEKTKALWRGRLKELSETLTSELAGCRERVSLAQITYENLDQDWDDYGLRVKVRDYDGEVDLNFIGYVDGGLLAFKQLRPVSIVDMSNLEILDGYVERLGAAREVVTAWHKAYKTCADNWGLNTSPLDD